ncbi:MAG: hypothetical protein KME60_29715 [Cyanomargarita calcarea GSE-NOS-MK-12-04C]|jgi:hypothetical protein|uniref:Pentapeptide MXKDX repeat protein n=1 Tax=Cyanomargarita calcarea GSE-NOS-MK-12-04C TaxID=2839659 RepID=A0A951UVT3_9CYAN|nr:hypothetical protein [Cyanomargarita calcarea GSE-NOS-MK-12-04C]
MNPKILCLIAGLTLSASLTACSGNPASNNQIAPEASPAMGGDAMGKDKAGDAMGGGAMGKDKAGDAMKQSPTPTTKP